MKAQILTLASGTFCQIESTGEESAFSSSILLPGGIAPHEGILQRAEEFDRKATQYARKASRCREAASLINKLE